MNAINPAVYAEAERFTDGAITPSILAGVAAMRGLPLYLTPPPGRDFDREIALAEAAVTKAREDHALFASLKPGDIIPWAGSFSMADAKFIAGWLAHSATRLQAALETLASERAAAESVIAATFAQAAE